MMRPLAEAAFSQSADLSVLNAYNSGWFFVDVMVAGSIFESNHAHQ